MPRIRQKRTKTGDCQNYWADILFVWGNQLRSLGPSCRMTSQSWTSVKPKSFRKTCFFQPTKPDWSSPFPVTPTQCVASNRWPVLWWDWFFQCLGDHPEEFPACWESREWQIFLGHAWNHPPVSTTDSFLERRACRNSWHQRANSACTSGPLKGWNPATWERGYDEDVSPSSCSIRLDRYNFHRSIQVDFISMSRIIIAHYRYSLHFRHIPPWFMVHQYPSAGFLWK